MNKKKVLVGIFVLLIGIPLFLFFISLARQKGPIAEKPPTILSPTITQAVSLLSVVSTAPQNNNTDVKTSSSIQIVYNKEFDLSALSVTISPNITYNLNRISNTLYITPSELLKTNTTYTVNIAGSSMLTPYALSFSTANQNPQGVGPDPEGFLQGEDELREAYPDAYLANHLPYSESTFSITVSTDFKTGVKTFTITLKGSDSLVSKKNAINWMKSLRLTDQQIQTFTIVYQ